MSKLSMPAVTPTFMSIRDKNPAEQDPYNLTIQYRSRDTLCMDSDHAEIVHHALYGLAVFEVDRRCLDTPRHTIYRIWGCWPDRHEKVLRVFTLHILHYAYNQAMIENERGEMVPYVKKTTPPDPNEIFRDAYRRGIHVSFKANTNLMQRFHGSSEFLSFMLHNQFKWRTILKENDLFIKDNVCLNTVLGLLFKEMLKTENATLKEVLSFRSFDLKWNSDQSYLGTLAFDSIRIEYGMITMGGIETRIRWFKANKKEIYRQTTPIIVKRLKQAKFDMVKPEMLRIDRVELTPDSCLVIYIEWREEYHDFKTKLRRKAGGKNHFTTVDMSLDTYIPRADPIKGDKSHKRKPSSKSKQKEDDAT